MLPDKYEHFHSDMSLDDMKDGIVYWLKKSFPWISDSVIEKNVAFVELLNEYNWPSFRWIYYFLDRKWYDVISINLDNGNNRPFTDDLIKSVKSWNILIWFKVFIENYWTDKQKFLTYNVLAKKKNKIDLETLKSKIFDLLSWKKLSSENL